MARDHDEDPDSPDGDDEEHREVYARFGLAFYLAECVYRGLVHAFAYLPYDGVTGTRPWVVERDDRASAMTMGELATEAKPFLPAEMHGRIDWAVECRNHLAHGFWYQYPFTGSSMSSVSHAIPPIGLDIVDSTVHSLAVQAFSSVWDATGATTASTS